MSKSESVALVLEVDPGLGRINGRAVMRQRGRGRGAKRFVGKSDAYKGFMADVSLEARKVATSVGRFEAGALGVSITFYVPAMREGFPDLDVDASIKATLDGLVRGGLIDDDRRFMECHARKRFDPRRPRVTVLVYRLTESA